MRARYFSTLILAVLSAASAGPAALAQGGPPQEVTVGTVTERNLPATIRLVGTILPDRTATVAAEVDGIVAEFTPREGHFLKRGDVICRLDPEVATLRRDEALAELERRKEELAELEAGERPEEIERLEAVIEEAEARLEQWRLERERVQGLREGRQATPKEWNDASQEYAAASGKLRQARADLEKAKNGPRKEEIARARFDVKAQEAVLTRLARDLAKTEIRAPFDAFLVVKNTEVGEWIDAGGAVCQIVAMETVKVRVNVPEEVTPFARPDAPARVTIVALNESLPAKISRLVPLAAESARTFPVEIDLPNADHRLLPGMYVWANVPSGPSGTRLMVSKDAIVPRGMDKQIFVIRRGGETPMAMPMNVETGLEDGELIEIRAPGIKAGDQVVTRANERLYGPSPVIPTPPATSQPAPNPPASQTTTESTDVK